MFYVGEHLQGKVEQGGAARKRSKANDAMSLTWGVDQGKENRAFCNQRCAIPQTGRVYNAAPALAEQRSLSSHALLSY